MAIPGAHNRVAVQGALIQQVGGGSDIFSFGWADMSSLTPAALSAIVLAEMKQVWSSSTYSCQLSVNAQLLKVRVDTIDALGHVTGGYTSSVSSGTYLGLNTNKTDTLTCLCVSLETGQLDAKGNLIRGRFFPPGAPGNPVGSTFSTSDANSYAGLWQASFTRMKAAGQMVAVASSTSVGLAAATGITAATVVDTMRTRKNRVTRQRSTVHTI